MTYLTSSRRDLLLSAGGLLAVATTVGQTQSAKAANGSVGISACPREHGGVGDGAFRPLADRFPTLAAARAVYPFATALRQSLDWAAIQSAINVVEPLAGRVIIPVGRWILSDSIQLPSSVTLEGESREGSVIDNQNHPLDAPQIVNKDPVAFLYATIRNLTLNGGSHGIRVIATREVAGIVIEGITANLQAVANIEFSSLQTTVIRDCHLINGQHGISVLGFPCNSVHIINTRLGAHSDSSLRLRGADLVMMIGGSMEAGGVAGKATIDIETGGAYANALSFHYVYFENTHEYLLRSRGTKAVSFDGCKMTGTSRGGAVFQSYRFDCEKDIITFGTNQWDQFTTGPSTMVLAGSNENLGGNCNVWTARSAGLGALCSRYFDFSSRATTALFWLDGGARLPNTRFTGRVRLDVDGNDATGRTVTRSRFYTLHAEAKSNAALRVWMEDEAIPGARAVELVATASLGGNTVISARALDVEGFTPTGISFGLNYNDRWPGAASMIRTIPA